MPGGEARFEIFGDGLPEDRVVSAYVAVERLGMPPEATVEFSTGLRDFRVGELLRKQLTLEVRGTGGESRLFDGIAHEAVFTRVVGQRFHFRVTLRSSLAALAFRSDARIFQNISVPDVVRKLLEEANLTKQSKFDLTGTYPEREFIVQYRESTLNFIQRLCEEVGIFTFQEHSKDGHCINFVDRLDAMEVLGDPIPFGLTEGAGVFSPLDTCSRTKAIRTSSVVLRDFDVEQPVVFPEGELPIESKSPQSYYDYPGGFGDAEGGKRAVAVRIKRLRADADVLEGSCRRTDLACGRRISIESSDEADLLGTFYITELTLTGTEHGEGAAVTRASFRAVPEGAVYLPPARARVPRIAGIQTAVVVGREVAAQSIHVDRLGRIKVHFHWDRMQAFDDNASCWLRVSQLPLGGSMILPRVGWEVSVAFLEGDPSRPLVLGRAYNAENMPPMSLPDNKACGSFSSASSPGGAGANEISLGDSGGSQGFSLKAQKDMNMSTGFDQTEQVTVDDEAQINQNQSRTVKVDETLTVAGNQTATYGAHCSCKVKADHTVSVGGNETANSTGNFLEKIGADRAFMVGGNQLGLSNGERIAVSGTTKREVGGNEIVCTASSMSHNILGSSKSKVGAARVHLVKGSHGETVTASKSVTISAAAVHVCKADMTSSCEGAVARLVGGVVKRKVTGTFTIKAPMITLTGAKGTFKGGSGVMDLAGGPIKLKGSAIVFKAGVVKLTSGSLKLG